MNEIKKYKCVIFDCDGVLVDSEPLAEETIIEMARELGADIDIPYAKKNFKGDSFKNIVKQLESIFNLLLPDNFESEFRRRSFEKFSNRLQPIKGIKSVLKSLDVPFCVASSGPQDKIKHNLKLTGLLPFFEKNIFSCYDIQKWKPEPDIFLDAASKMGFSINECIVIEDTFIGISAAKRGGFDVFGFADDFNQEQFNKETTNYFKDMTELQSLFQIHL